MPWHFATRWCTAKRHSWRKSQRKERSPRRSTAKGTTTRRVIESCFQIHEQLNTGEACPTSLGTFGFSCRIALCGVAWEKRVASAWSSYSTIAGLPGNLWRSFPTDWVSSRKQRGAAVRPSDPTHHRGNYVIRRKVASFYRAGRSE